MSSLSDLPSWAIEHLVDRIGSDDPAPRGGAAGGVAIALAAACARKAIIITLKRRPDDAELSVAADRLGLIARRALEGASGDAVAFERLMAAYRLPKGSPSETEARHSAIRKQALQTASVSADLKSLAMEVRAIIDALAPSISPNMINDVRAARALADAGEHIQDDNHDANMQIAG